MKNTDRTFFEGLYGRNSIEFVKGLVYIYPFGIIGKENNNNVKPHIHNNQFQFFLVIEGSTLLIHNNERIAVSAPSALRLFTINGARATSTKAIAEEANTSEALIFRHFETKDNLLERIIRQGYQEAATFTAAFLTHKEPKEFLIKMIDLPYVLVDSNFDFWRMQYKILPLNPISQQYHTNFMKLSKDQLSETFRLLGYEDPAGESDILILIIEGVWKSFASDRLTDERCKALIELLKKKYSIVE